MAAEKVPTFVLPIKLYTDERDEKRIEQELEINRVLYNTCLGELLKRETNMKRTKRFKKCLRAYRAISKKLECAKRQENEREIAFYIREKAAVTAEFAELRNAFGVTEYSLHAYVKPIRAHFGNRINSAIAQKTATRAWNTFQNKQFGGAKKLKFIRKGEMDAFEGKSNTTGWVFQGRKIRYGKRSIELKLKPNDAYLREALHLMESGQTFTYKNTKGETKTEIYRVKYVQIVRKFLRGKAIYYAHLVCAGYPPVKKDRNGRPRHTMGSGRVGIDIGTSSVAAVSGSAVSLRNLGEKIKRIDSAKQEIRSIQRAMDRSKRAMNPANYNEDGTIKKGRETWTFSNRYRKLRGRCRSRQRRLAVLRKLSHQRMANEFLALGDAFYIEDMRFRALQKRARKTEKSEKTGKFKKKKRFGKTIANRAPALFVQILKDKVLAGGGTFTALDTTSFKASQYDHTTGECVKKELNERWHRFSDGTAIQRDLYSAFLLMNADAHGKKPDRALCETAFNRFKVNHDLEINRIEQSDTIILNSGIRLNTNKTAAIV